MHVTGRSGGAQYGRGVSPEDDRLVVDADAFVRAADPEDFSLEAMIAHERGHQILCRHPRVRRTLASRLSLVSEEVVASIVGSLIVTAPEDRKLLVLKATYDAANRGLSNETVDRLITSVRDCLEDML